MMLKSVRKTEMQMNTLDWINKQKDKEDTLVLYA